MIVTFENQKEIDYYWNVLTADGGNEGSCGWLKDKYGLSWQIASSVMKEDTKKQIAKVTQAFMQMKKFDIAKLEEAFNS